MKRLDMQPIVLSDPKRDLGFRAAEQAVVEKGDRTYVINRKARRPNIGVYKPGLYTVYDRRPGEPANELFHGFATSPDHALKRTEKAETRKGAHV